MKLEEINVGDLFLQTWNGNIVEIVMVTAKEAESRFIYPSVTTRVTFSQVEDRIGTIRRWSQDTIDRRDIRPLEHRRTECKQ